MKKNALSILLIVVFMVCCLVPIAQGSTVKSEQKADEILSNPSAPKMADEILSKPLAPVAVQPAVTAAQQKEWEMKLNRLYNQVNGKKGLFQRLTSVEKEIASENGAAEKAQITADEAKKIAESNNLKIDGLNTRVVDLDKRLKSLAESAITTGLAIFYAIGMVVVFSIIMGLIVWLITRKKKEGKEAA